MSGYMESTSNYFTGDFGTGDTIKQLFAEGNSKNEIAFYQSIFSGEPVIRFASEETIRFAYEALAVGGKIVKPIMEAPIGGLYAAVTDRNGIRWNLQFDKGWKSA